MTDNKIDKVINQGDIGSQTIVNIGTMNGNYYESGTPLTAADFYRELLTYLESKRVIYYGCESENLEHCTESVLEIKRDLKDRIKRRGLNRIELGSVNRMFDACNAYLDTIDNHHNCGSKCPLKEALTVLRDCFKSAIKGVESDYGLKFRQTIQPPCRL